MVNGNKGAGSAEILERLAARIAERTTASPESSYTARLYAQGIKRIRQKVGEEAVEVILARGREELASEAADLLYHLLLLLEMSEMSASDVYAELERRFQSGHRTRDGIAPSR